MNEKYTQEIKYGSILEFDAKFESGNLDKVIMVNENEYDLYMRVDSNTAGHFQWFYFKVNNKIKKEVKFNVLNFTKASSLYENGMKVCYCSIQEREK